MSCEYCCFCCSFCTWTVTCRIRHAIIIFYVYLIPHFTEVHNYNMDSDTYLPTRYMYMPCIDSEITFSISMSQLRYTSIASCESLYLFCSMYMYMQICFQFNIIIIIIIMLAYSTSAPFEVCSQ